jgi:transcriptional regulator with XRE-family HTH domain
LPPSRLSRGQRTPIDAIDRRIAGRLRLRRVQLKIQPAAVEMAVGLRSGALKRFEGAVRPIPASLLFRLATLLEVDVDYFFAADAAAEARAPQPPSPESAAADGAQRDLAEARRFLAFYTHLQDGEVRRQVRELVRSIAGGSGAGSSGAESPGQPGQNKVGKDRQIAR